MEFVTWFPYTHQWLFLQYLYPLFILLFHPFSHVLGGHWNFMYTVKLYFAPYKRHLIINEFSLLPRTRGNNIKICAPFYGVFLSQTHTHIPCLSLLFYLYPSIYLSSYYSWMGNGKGVEYKKLEMGHVSS